MELINPFDSFSFRASFCAMRPVLNKHKTGMYPNIDNKDCKKITNNHFYFLLLKSQKACLSRVFLFFIRIMAFIDFIKRIPFVLTHNYITMGYFVFV
jgi:hypothetical protein